MYSNHSILVNTTYAANAADKNLSEMIKEEIKEMVINYATEETERFRDSAFDDRFLCNESNTEEDEDPRSVIFASEDSTIPLQP